MRPTIFDARKHSDRNVGNECICRVARVPRAQTEQTAGLGRADCTATALRSAPRETEKLRRPQLSPAIEGACCVGIDRGPGTTAGVFEKATDDAAGPLDPWIVPIDPLTPVFLHAVQVGRGAALHQPLDRSLRPLLHAIGSVSSLSKLLNQPFKKARLETPHGGTGGWLTSSDQFGLSSLSGADFGGAPLGPAYA